MSSQSRGWGPGWPADRSRDQRPLRWITGSVHKDVHALIDTLCQATVERGYPIRKDWSWGFANRPIRGTRRPSNHSWGLAVDINAPKNPMGSRLITDMPPWMPAMWKDCGFAWGGDYRSRPDAMHYEYMGRPQDVAGHLAKARRYLTGSVPTEDTEEDDMRFSEQQIKELQHLTNRGINESGGWEGTGLTALQVDGVWGTKSALAAWHLLERIRLAVPEDRRPNSLYVDHEEPSPVMVGYFTAAVSS